MAGLPTLRSALAKRLTGMDGQQVAPSQIHVGCGCTHALFCAARAILNPGDEVLVVTPYWPLIAGVLRTVGAVVVEVPLTQALYRDEGFDIVATLEQASTTRTRALYLVSPNNPDGHVYQAAQLAQFAAFAQRHNLWVLSDEVYADYSYDRPHMSIAHQPEMAARTIRSFSLSKSHGLAGARIGYVVAQPAVIDATRRISNHTVYNVPAAMQHVALAALEDDGWPSTCPRRVPSSPRCHRRSLDGSTAFATVSRTEGRFSSWKWPTVWGGARSTICWRRPLNGGCYWRPEGLLVTRIKRRCGCVLRGRRCPPSSKASPGWPLRWGACHDGTVGAAAAAQGCESSRGGGGAGGRGVLRRTGHEC